MLARRFQERSAMGSTIRSCHAGRRVFARLLVSVMAVLTQAGVVHAQDASIATRNGRVEIAPPQADGIRVFKGLAYAAPPVGELRWQPPQALSAWKGTIRTDTFSPDCLQPDNDASPSSRAKSEDCLYLNVWTPRIKGAANPVFVWIHGGGSQFGSGAQPQFDGSALARQGIVVVTFNYRLGALGFLSTPDLSRASGYGASGNYGFMDQLAALRWIRDNIANFGGDPRRVTIGGESSGSVSAGTLMASPLARGLFSGVIGESGSVMRVVGEGSMGADTLAREEAKGALLMKEMGAASVAEMRKAPASEVLAAAGRLFPKYFYNVPVVDGYLLPDAPSRIFAAHAQNDVPLLVGWNSGEGSMELMFRGSFPPAIEQLRAHYGAYSEQIAKYYARMPSDPLNTGLAISGDAAFGYPTWKWGYAQVRSGKSPTFIYRFDWAPQLAPGLFGTRFDVRHAGSFHGAEVPYVFGTLQHMAGWKIGPDDLRVSEQMTRYWANFIRAGNPNGAGLADWPAYAPSAAPKRMALGLLPAAATDPDFAKFRAIDAFYSEAGPADPGPPKRP